MVDTDKYLRELDELSQDVERKHKFREARKRYKGREQDLAHSFRLVEEYLEASNEEVYNKRGDAQAAAYAILNKANRPNAYITGAELYEKLGKGKKAIPMLMRRVKDSVKNNRIDINDLNKVKEFIKRNTKKKQSGLEGKLPIFLLFTIAGIALSLSSLNSTGYAISSLTQTSSGLLGVIFFIVGIAGIFFNFKK